MSSVFLTGGTGLLGGHVADKFRSAGYEVYCLARKDSDVSFIKSIGCKVIPGDLGDLDTLEKAMIQVDGVIHTAAKVGDWGSYDDFYDANVTGTLNVLDAARKAKIKKIIITGSISSYGEENYLGTKNESYPYTSHYDYFLDKLFPCKMNYYRDTKALGTIEAMKYASESEMVITILEPVWIYGERETNSGFYEYIKTAKQGIPFLPGNKRSKFHAMYAGDLANVYYKIFESKIDNTQAYLVGPPTAPVMDELYRTLTDAAGIKKPKNIPKWVIYPFGFMLEFAATIMNSKNPPLLTRGRVNLFYDNIEYDTSKIHDFFEGIEMLSLSEGIGKTVKWYKNNQWI